MSAAPTEIPININIDYLIFSSTPFAKGTLPTALRAPSIKCFHRRDSAGRPPELNIDFVLPPMSTLLQYVPYGYKREHYERHKIAHVATTTLGHHCVDPSKGASEQTPSIKHLPLHAAY